jgi:hypothetical protein
MARKRVSTGEERLLEHCIERHQSDEKRVLVYESYTLLKATYWFLGFEINFSIVVMASFDAPELICLD